MGPEEFTGRIHSSDIRPIEKKIVAHVAKVATKWQVIVPLKKNLDYYIQSFVGPQLVGK